ncbi:MAG TPA: hypothetical protein VKA84_01520 [Gemmatimonadaceae bacterium]|nr:hypothetical protein [Gemmatimonadaceae bacterium]
MADPLVHDYLRAFLRERGRLPARLNEVCAGRQPPAAGDVWGCPMGFGDFFLDAWGRPPAVEPAGGDTAYVLRSAGPDGELGTADDIRSLDPSPAWRPLLIRAAGCYAWLPAAAARRSPLRGAARGVPRFRLDTLAGAWGVEVGGYEMRPKWVGRRESAAPDELRSIWRPIPPDTLALTWGSAFYGLSARFALRGDTLHGTAGTYSDDQGSRASRDSAASPPIAAAVRVPCPAATGRPR